MSNEPFADHHHQVDVKQTNLLINGVFKASQKGKTFETISPVTEKKIADVALGDKADIDEAVKAARAALADGPWRTMPARERGNILFRWAELIDKHQKELAKLEVLDNGKPITQAMGDIAGSAATIRYFAGLADKIEGRTIPISGDYLTFTRREPVGVCGLIIPWNYPLPMAAWKLAPCFAAGCTAVLKPAEQTPLTALRAGELALEAGLPPGVLNIVPGFGEQGAGEALVAHPDVDKIAFTGEGKTADIIKAKTVGSGKRLSFELGGKSPNIIFDDVDVDEVVDGAVGAIFSNQGQNCCAGSRLYVHKKIINAFVEKFVKKAASRRIGCPYDKSTEHGPQIDKAQFDKIMHFVELGKSQGAECVTGGKRFGDLGFYVEPTVFSNVDDKMSIATDEIFGPVASVLSFDDVGDVIRRANRTHYGLAGAVWTNNMDRALTVVDNVKAGTMWVNCYNVVDPAAPFGGFKKSGTGRELSQQALDLYTETKTVTIARRNELG